MPYPDEAEGFQVDGPETFTEFHKRFVGSCDAHPKTVPNKLSGDLVQAEAIW